MQCLRDGFTGSLGDGAGVDPVRSDQIWATVHGLVSLYLDGCFPEQTADGLCEWVERAVTGVIVGVPEQESRR